jgi:hypothetical protein
MAMAAARARGPAISPWLRRLAIAVLAALAGLAAWLLWRTAVLTPYWDELDWIERWRALREHGDWGLYLLGPHNLHRQPWTFGLIALDIQLFGGTNLPLILSGALAVGLMAWLLAQAAADAAPNGLALPAGVLAAGLALMPGNVLDAATPICADYTHGAVLAVLALVLGEGAGPGLGWRRLAALAAAVAAGLGDAVALAVWPALAIGAARRRDWAWLAAVLGVGAAFVGLYASGQGAAAHSDSRVALQAPLRAVRLALTYLALPWARLNIGMAWIGGAAIGAAGLLAAAFRGGREATPAERIASGFILFSLTTAAMAGLGRAGAPDALNVPLRYAVLLAPLQVGLVMLALPLAGDLRRANRGLADGLAGALLSLVLVQNAVMAASAVRVSDEVRAAVTDFAAGRRTPRSAVFVHPDLAYAQRAYADIRKDGLFRRELHLKARTAAR